jgi:hypothetical protein
LKSVASRAVVVASSVGRPESREWCYTLLVEADACSSLPSQLFGERALYSLCEHTNYEVYAALHAAGCPRLAFLLTDLDPRDPLDEELASWKIWLVRAVKRAERVAEPIEVLARYCRGEIGAEAARELLHKRVVELREWYEGFFVPAFYLRKLGGDTLKELWEKALRGDVRAAARLSVNAELERLTRMAEAGFPNIYRIFDRFLDAMSLMGERQRRYARATIPRGGAEGVGGGGGRCAGGRQVRSRPAVVRWGAGGVEAGFGGEAAPPLLKGVARLLAPAYLHRVEGYIRVHPP